MPSRKTPSKGCHCPARPAVRSGYQDPLLGKPGSATRKFSQTMLLDPPLIGDGRDPVADIAYCADFFNPVGDLPGQHLYAA